MPGYISEVMYHGDSSQEFIEIAVPKHIDTSSYTVYLYDAFGNVTDSFSLGTAVANYGGTSVYVIDASTPGFTTVNPLGKLMDETGIALVDDTGTVLQFVSIGPGTITATQGPASGMTSTSIGDSNLNESLQSDDGGTSYFSQSSPNAGVTAACYGPGTLIRTPSGAKPVETLNPGDLVLSDDGTAQPVRWTWSGEEALETLGRDRKPVLIREGAFGSGLPEKDLVVSGQHRIVVGAHGQLEGLFPEPMMVPAKALTSLPRIRFMAGKRAITWYHFLCDSHRVVYANNIASESLLLGSVITRSLAPVELEKLSIALGRAIVPGVDDPPALPCLSVGNTRRIIDASKRKGQAGKKSRAMASAGRAKLRGRGGTHGKAGFLQELIKYAETSNAVNVRGAGKVPRLRLVSNRERGKLAGL